MKLLRTYLSLTVSREKGNHQDTSIRRSEERRDSIEKASKKQPEQIKVSFIYREMN